MNRHRSTSSRNARRSASWTPLRFVRRRIIARRLPAYVRGEQSPAARRETARWLDRDAGLYSEYRRLRDDDSALRTDLAPYGRAERVQLDRAFANIGAALNGHAPLYRLRVRRLNGWRATVAAVMLAAMLIVPLAASFNRVAAIGIPTQPQPRSAVDEAITATGGAAADEQPDQTLTPALATAQLVTRATPTAPEKE